MRVSLDEKIIIIGDSHVRSFGYCNDLLPLFIGPAAFNNFLTEESSNRVRAKILELLEPFSDDKINLLLFFNGDVEHVKRKSDGVCQSEFEILNKSVNRYFELIDHIRVYFKRVNLMISSVAPGFTEVYREYQNHYNRQLNNYCELNGVSFININDKITEDGFVKYPYYSDFVHVSYRAVYEYHKGIKQFVPDLPVFIDDYKWSYIYELDTSKGPFKIWGGINKEDLEVRNYEKLPLSSFSVKSNALSKSVTDIVNFINNKEEGLKYTVLNCKEGFLAFEILKKHKVVVNGIDFEKRNIQNGINLAFLAKTENFKFHHMDEGI